MRVPRKYSNSFKIWNIDELLKKQQGKALAAQESLKKIADSAPLDPQQFYESFGLLTHSRTKQPAPKLTLYQTEIWKHPSKYKLVIKSQKVGISTSELLHDFQLSITRCRGQDILIIAQTLKAAYEHLNTLKFLLANSERYGQFLITEPREMLFKEMQTKVGVAYIHNPDNPNKPTRIIALGSKEGAVWSWKNVAHIHMSDVAIASQVDDTGLFAAAFSRLANTNGTMTIETPPHGMRNQVYRIYMQSRMKTDLDAPESQFKVFQVTAREAVQAGLITEDFLESEKQRLGPRYAMYYEAEFISGVGNVFNIDAIDWSINEGQRHGYDIRSDLFNSTSLGIDPAFGSSKFAMVVTQFVGDGNKVRVVFAREYESPDYNTMVEEAYYLMSKYQVDLTYVDGANPEFIKSLKLQIGEPTDYHERIAQAKKEGFLNLKPQDIMKIVPVNFGPEGREMLAHAKNLVESHKLCIHPDFEALLNEMRAAIAIDGKLDKSIYTHDILDAFQLALKFYSFQQV